LLSFYYICLFLWFITGWNKLLRKKETETTSASSVLPFDEIHFSIIIPARNESGNIKHCLQGIIAQQYPYRHFEIIVIDDFSEDDTANIVQEIIERNTTYSIQLICLSDHYEPNSLNAWKKAGLALGIQKAKGKWIITTDADCHHPNGWLAAYARHINTNQAVFVSGPVALIPENSFFSKWQALEFAGLNAIGAACILQNKPTLCNGANLAYTKDAYNACGGFSGINGIASGDDELMMHKMNALYKGQITYLADEQALVTTMPARDVKTFIAQRKRWVSKSRLYNEKRITLILATAYLFNASILLLWVLAFQSEVAAYALVVALLAKIAPEAWLYRRSLGFFKLNTLKSLIIQGSLLHIIYVLFIGIYGNFGKYNWKGRSVK
jgi:cellulose synthase/poly-beta-1,6-N-acetylglucosamine synthase-like glycosyltransferase